jgi:hypothetical protein
VELRIRVVTLPLPAGRVLRVARLGDVLVVADGFQQADVLRELARGVRVPAASWPSLRQALDELVGE